MFKGENMPLNKVICLKQTNDNFFVFKCLKCKGKEWFSKDRKPFDYCPYCGIKFEGEQENKKIKIENKITKFSLPNRVILIESKTISNNKWYIIRVCNSLTPAKKVLNWIKELRGPTDVDFKQTQIRYRVVPYNKEKYGTNIWN